MAQAETRVRSQASPYGIYDGQGGILWILRICPCHYHSTIAPYSYFTHLPTTLNDLSIRQPPNNSEERKPNTPRRKPVITQTDGVITFTPSEKDKCSTWCTTIHGTTYFLLRRWPNRLVRSSQSKEAMFYDCSMNKERNTLTFHKLANVQTQTLPSWTRPVAQWKANPVCYLQLNT